MPNRLRIVALVAAASVAFAAPALAEKTAAKPDGVKVYEANCAACHGAKGHGDGPAAAALKPAPRDLVVGEFAHGDSAEAIRRTIAAGLPKTSMPPFEGTLSAGELEAVAAYVAAMRKADGHKKKAPKGDH